MVLLDVYQRLNYFVREILNKPQDIREQAFFDRLRREGLSLVSVNLGLDRNRVPLEYGRCPQVFRRYPDLIDSGHSYLDQFNKTSSERRPDIRKRDLVDFFSLKLAEDLEQRFAFSRETFEKIMGVE